MTTKYYFDKEQYLKIKEAWSAAVNSPKTKSHLKPCDEYIKQPHYRYEFSRGTGTEVVPGWITSAHMMLYNIIRGKHPQHGFRPFSRCSKIQGMGMINKGAYEAYTALKNHMWNARQDWINDFQKEKLDRFLEPFNGTLTQEDLKNIDLPEVNIVWSTFGPGMRIAGRICDDGLEVKTCEELISVYEEVSKEYKS